MGCHAPDRHQRILVIANPTAGRRHHKTLTSILEILRELGCDLVVQTTTARGDAENMARALTPNQFDVVAIAGGDGTINEVLNGLEKTSPPVAIIPIGTANVLAAEIGLGALPLSIADTIAFGHRQAMSLGVANGRRFAVMASVGLDAEVVDHVNPSLKHYLGKGAYVWETLHQVITFRPPIFELSVDEKPLHAHSILVANGRFFAGRFIVAPDARLERPSLDVCRYMRSSRVAMVSYLISMVRGRLADRDDFKISRGTSIRINGPKGTPVQADGDVITELPAIIDVLPDAVDLMFPRNHVGMPS